MSTASAATGQTGAAPADRIDPRPETARNPTSQTADRTQLPPVLDELRAELRELAVLKSISSVLGWDEQVNLRPAGAEHRAEQLSVMAGLTHDRSTSKMLGDLIAAAEEVALPDDHPFSAVVSDARREYRRATCLPRSLVQNLSRTTLLAQQAWVAARRDSDFARFSPHLDRVVQLKREEADAVGSESGIRYDALLDDYEPGMTVELVDAAFAPLAASLSNLTESTDFRRLNQSTEVMERDYAIDSQRKLSRTVAESIGFDFAAGRIDEAAHPFCSSPGPQDCRLTTRYRSDLLTQGLYGTLHEAGHGLYEQGLLVDEFGTALGDACSLGIHESQSRLWENFVGRSREFWEFLMPIVRRIFPHAVGKSTVDDYFRAANVVRPSYIRVESDEVTYNLHIILRYELERELIDGDLAIADVPERWNTRFEELFGLAVTDDADGCLQDVHWSAGLIGYFPTYTLGNIYAAQLMESIRSQMPNLGEDIRQGRFSDLLGWLRREIHVYGRRYSPPTLIERATGRIPTSEPLTAYLTQKVDAILNSDRG